MLYLSSFTEADLDPEHPAVQINPFIMSGNDETTATHSPVCRLPDVAG
jgi:hypothetical protein